MKDLRVIFMGTPEFSIPVLKMLIENTNVVLVVSQPDAPVGRKRILTPSKVKELALSENIPVFTPEKLKLETQELFKYEADIIVTCAYGQIVPKEVLEYPRLGCINVHASLLPKYRGASPIAKCIKDGETETGITIMYMDETLDTGNIISQEKINIEENDTLGTLSEKLGVLGSDLLLKTLPKIIDGTNESIKQDDSLSSYAGLIKREDEKIDFNMTRKEIVNHIRSMNPEPLANTIINGEEWKIANAKVGSSEIGEIGLISNITKSSFDINCKDGKVTVLEVKLAGKKQMLVKDLFNGYKKDLLENKKVGE